MEKNDPIAEYRASLAALEFHELRTKAVKIFGLKLTREHKKEEIIALILGEMSKGNFAEQAEGELKPGYARIMIDRRENRPTLIYFNCNGYWGWIPVDVEVDVPIKVLGVLNDALEMKKMPDQDGNYQDVLSKSYPYTIIAKHEGPDPKPGREAATEKKWAPFRAFQKKFGKWPSQKVLEAFTMSSVRFSQFDIPAEEDE